MHCLFAVLYITQLPPFVVPLTSLCLFLRFLHSFFNLVVAFFTSFSLFSLLLFLIFIILYRPIFLRYLCLFTFHSHFIFPAFPSPINYSPYLVSFLLPTRIYVILFWALSYKFRKVLCFFTCLWVSFLVISLWTSSSESWSTEVQDTCVITLPSRLRFKMAVTVWCVFCS
jgi:hypothetical protein